MECLTLGFSKAKITKKLDRHRSSIGRGTDRNTIDVNIVPIKINPFILKGRMVLKKLEEKLVVTCYFMVP